MPDKYLSRLVADVVKELAASLDHHPEQPLWLVQTTRAKGVVQVHHVQSASSPPARNAVLSRPAAVRGAAQ